MSDSSATLSVHSSSSSTHLYHLSRSQSLVSLESLAFTTEYGVDLAEEVPSSTFSIFNPYRLDQLEIQQICWDFETNMKLRHYCPPHLGMLLVTETILSSYSLHVGARAASSLSSASLSIPKEKSVTNRGLVSNGLINLGNTCYLNSQLQCAFHIPHVRSLILNPLACQVEEEVRGNSQLAPGFLGLRHVFSQMVQSAANDENTSLLSTPVSTALLCRSLGINPMEQQDAQEFWKLLLPHLKCEPLLELYHGVYEDYVIACDGSGRERRRQESFLDLSLDVSSGSATDALTKMFKDPELLSEAEGNGWRPEKGAPKVDALKGHLLRSGGLPSLLQLHLKRFHFDWQTEIMSKLNDKFSFPQELDLSQICSESEDEAKSKPDNCTYDLQSIILHAGKFGSGHYYAYCRPDITKNSWYRFDDSRVTPVTFDEVKTDAFGGHQGNLHKGRKRKFLWLFGDGSSRENFGYGGKESCAYMIQYVKRSDIPLLYGR